MTNLQKLSVLIFRKSKKIIQANVGLPDCVMVNMLGKIFIKLHTDESFSYFSQKTGFDIACMECQIQFSGENKKKKSKCHLLNIFPTC